MDGVPGAEVTVADLGKLQVCIRNGLFAVRCEQCRAWNSTGYSTVTAVPLPVLYEVWAQHECRGTATRPAA